MNDLIVWRDKLQELYAMKSIYIDKAVQFVLALVTLLMINQNIGLMKAVATPVVAVALAVICTFLPPVVTAYVAAGLVIVHLFKLSIGVAARKTDLCGNVYLLLQIYSEKGTSSAGHTGSIYASCSVCGAGCLCACTWMEFQQYRLDLERSFTI